MPAEIIKPQDGGFDYILIETTCLLSDHEVKAEHSQKVAQVLANGYLPLPPTTMLIAMHQAVDDSDIGAPPIPIMYYCQPVFRIPQPGGGLAVARQMPGRLQ